MLTSDFYSQIHHEARSALSDGATSLILFYDLAFCENLKAAMLAGLGDYCVLVEGAAKRGLYHVPATVPL